MSDNTVALSSSRLRLRPSKGGSKGSAASIGALRLSSALVALMAQDYGEISTVIQ